MKNYRGANRTYQEVADKIGMKKQAVYAAEQTALCKMINNTRRELGQDKIKDIKKKDKDCMKEALSAYYELLRRDEWIDD